MTARFIALASVTIATGAALILIGETPLAGATIAGLTIVLAALSAVVIHRLTDPRRLYSSIALTCAGSLAVGAAIPGARIALRAMNLDLDVDIDGPSVPQLAIMGFVACAFGLLHAKTAPAPVTTDHAALPQMQLTRTRAWLLHWRISKEALRVATATRVSNEAEAASAASDPKSQPTDSIASSTLLTGEPGTGKTHRLLRIAARLSQSQIVIRVPTQTLSIITKTPAAPESSLALASLLAANPDFSNESLQVCLRHFQCALVADDIHRVAHPESTLKALTSWLRDTAGRKLPLIVAAARAARAERVAGFHTTAVESLSPQAARELFLSLIDNKSASLPPAAFLHAWQRTQLVVRLSATIAKKLEASADTSAIARVLQLDERSFWEEYVRNHLFGDGGHQIIALLPALKDLAWSTWPTYSTDHVDAPIEDARIWVRGLGRFEPQHPRLADFLTAERIAESNEWLPDSRRICDMEGYRQVFVLLRPNTAASLHGHGRGSPSLRQLAALGYSKGSAQSLQTAVVQWVTNREHDPSAGEHVQEAMQHGNVRDLVIAELANAIPNEDRVIRVTAAFGDADASDLLYSWLKDAIRIRPPTASPKEGLQCILYHKKALELLSTTGLERIGFSRSSLRELGSAWARNHLQDAAHKCLLRTINTLPEETLAHYAEDEDLRDLLMEVATKGEEKLRRTLAAASALHGRVLALAAGAYRIPRPPGKSGSRKKAGDPKKIELKNHLLVALAPRRGTKREAVVSDDELHLAIDVAFTERIARWHMAGDDEIEWVSDVDSHGYGRTGTNGSTALLLGASAPGSYKEMVRDITRLPPSDAFPRSK